jgi:ATP-dependent Clp protease ATP-binding subunit ClpB
VDIQVARLGRLLEDRNITLELSPAAREWLGRVGYDPVYGARPLKRAVQKYLQDPLADAILAGKIVDGQTIQVDEGDGQLVLTSAEAGEPVPQAAE